MKELDQYSPSKIRSLIRKKEIKEPTAGMAAGFAQANLIILPENLAFEFMLFAQRNPKPCPILDVMEPGQYQPVLTAPKADLRTDLPRYRIYENGILKEEVTDIKDYWQKDFVSFLIGCSFTFESALLEASIPIRHIEEGKNVPMYKTNIQCREAGIFQGPLVVTMRPLSGKQIVQAVQITSEYEKVHGTPIHIGDPTKIGIEDLGSSDFGETVTVQQDELPVFWACGVTPQAVAMESKPSMMITHSPGHMFITDVENKELSDL